MIIITHIDKFFHNSPGDHTGALLMFKAFSSYSHCVHNQKFFFSLISNTSLLLPPTRFPYIKTLQASIENVIIKNSAGGIPVVCINKNFCNTERYYLNNAKKEQFL